MCRYSDITKYYYTITGLSVFVCNLWLYYHHIVPFVIVHMFIDFDNFLLISKFKIVNPFFRNLDVFEQAIFKIMIVYIYPRKFAHLYLSRLPIVRNLFETTKRRSSRTWKRYVLTENPEKYVVVQFARIYVHISDQDLNQIRGIQTTLVNVCTNEWSEKKNTTSFRLGGKIRTDTTAVGTTSTVVMENSPLETIENPQKKGC